MVLLRVLGALLCGDGGGGVFFRCRSVWIVVEREEGDGVAVFPAVERYQGVEAVPSVPGRARVGFGCCFQEGVLGAFPGVFPEKVFLCVPLLCRFFSPASTPGGSRGPQGGLFGWTGSTARRPWGLGCWPVSRRCPLGGGGGGGGVAARSGSGFSCWCSAFWSAVEAGDMERGGMGWSGSCGSAGCWWACGRKAVAASRCGMARRTS